MPSGFAEPDALVKPTPMTIAVIMTNTDWAKANPQLIQNYYTAYLRGVRDYCNAYHGAPIKNEIIDLLIRHGSERRPELLHKYPWPARSPNGRINTASMLDMQDWFVKNGFSRTKFPAARLVDSRYADAAVREARALRSRQSGLQARRLPVVRVLMKLTHPQTSSPGLTRRSRSGGHGGSIVEMAGSSPAMTILCERSAP